MKYKSQVDPINKPASRKALEDVKYVAMLEEQKLAD